jgi:hypothetical protein
MLRLGRRVGTYREMAEITIQYRSSTKAATFPMLGGQAVRIWL